MKYITIKNWDKWQTYRKDRGQPPWIKIHRRIMRNPEWVGLSDAERGQLVAMWLLAADHDGVIPASADIIQKLCFMSDVPDLKKFNDLGFLDYGCQGDATLTPERRQLDAPKAEAETEAETEAEADSGGDAALTPPQKNGSCPYNKIIEIYHEILPQLPQVTCLTEPLKKSIKARWKEDKKHQTIEWWEWYFKGVSQCDFLIGKEKDWSADFTWLIGPKNMTKVLNGRYLNRKGIKEKSAVEDFVNEQR